MSSALNEISHDQKAAARLRRTTLFWFVVVGFLFLTLTLDGCFLRMYQSQFFPTLRAEWFYAVLTLHGVGMLAVWFAAGMAAVTYLLSNYLRPPLWASPAALGGTLLGFGLLFVATTRGLFGAGWHFLFPLPFYSQGTWPDWATGCFFASIVVFSTFWLIWSLALIIAILRRYSFRTSLGWHYLSGRKAPEIPPLVLITMVALVSAVTGFLELLALFFFYFLQWRVKDFVANPLLMKNLTFFYGHLLVLASMYLGVAIVYDQLPTFNNREWKTNKIIVIAWNSVLVMVLMGFFDQLYMDIVHPRMPQVMGQATAYFSAVPAAVISIFDGLLLVYGSRMRWTVGSTFMFLGLMGWAAGGVGAVIDSMMADNSVLHNTLWAPAHLHTFYLMGVVLMILGFAYDLGSRLSRLPESRMLKGLILTTFIAGGYGFVILGFWSGAHSVPRRYATYPEGLTHATTYARTAVAFIIVFIFGLVLFLWEIGRRYFRAIFT
ncbi:MAG TPA: cbb3-type cytochrome c oxidase subunit I [Terriglobia bacterium]|nr:cbb3-type cytochrome c oxidase subunit I [Terriglobia bacterium]